MALSIPTATVGRLVTYLRVLDELEAEGIDKTSSEMLGRRAQVTAFQVRKDLAYCGRLGRRGSGYLVVSLQRELRRVLGLARSWRIAIVGMGRLGQAVADYPNFDPKDFVLRAAFDVDARKVGLAVGALVVRHVGELPRAVAEDGIDLAFLTVPAHAAQAAADATVRAGVRGILNFAPAVLEVPEGVRVENVDFLAGLTRLTYSVGGPAASADVS